MSHLPDEISIIRAQNDGFVVTPLVRNEGPTTLIASFTSATDLIAWLTGELIRNRQARSGPVERAGGRLESATLTPARPRLVPQGSPNDNEEDRS